MNNQKNLRISGSRAQFNLLTATIDANTVYGVRETFSRSLRSGYGGQMRVNPVLRSYGLKDLLPPKTDIPDEGCTRSNPNQLCFDGGEIRVNEQLILASQHTLWVRQHNLVATQLAQINSHWDDEQLFQETRHIIIGMIQHICFNEFLPVVLGKDAITKFNLLLQKEVTHHEAISRRKQPEKTRIFLVNESSAVHHVPCGHLLTEIVTTRHRLAAFSPLANKNKS